MSHRGANGNEVRDKTDWFGNPVTNIWGDQAHQVNDDGWRDAKSGEVGHGIFGGHTVNDPDYPGPSYGGSSSSSSSNASDFGCLIGILIAVAIGILSGVSEHYSNMQAGKRVAAQSAPVMPAPKPLWPTKMLGPKPKTAEDKSLKRTVVSAPKHNNETAFPQIHYGYTHHRWVKIWLDKGIVALDWTLVNAGVRTKGKIDVPSRINYVKIHLLCHGTLFITGVGNGSIRTNELVFKIE